MTNATETPEAEIISPPPPPSIMTELIREAKANKIAGIEDALESTRKKLEKAVEKDASAAQLRAIGEKNLELVNAVRENLDAVLTALGITLPEKGLKWTLEAVPSINGTRTISMANFEKAPRKNAAGTGTRAANGTGTGRDSIMSPTIDGVKASTTGFILENGSEVTAASQVAKGVNVFKEGENQGRTVLAWAKANRDEANKIQIVVNGVKSPLGDFVATHYAARIAASVA